MTSDQATRAAKLVESPEKLPFIAPSQLALPDDYGGVRVLVIENDPSDADSTLRALTDDDLPFTAAVVSGRQAYLDEIDRRRPNVILAAYAAPGLSGPEALAIARQRCPDVPFIFVTGGLSDESAVDLIRAGATDYVLKGALSRLAVAVRRALLEAAWARQRAIFEAQARVAAREAAETLVLLDTLQTAAPIGLGFVDRDFRMIRLNETLASVSGSRAADQIGRKVSENVPQLWPQLEPLYRAALVTGVPVVNLEVTGIAGADSTKTHYWLNSLYPVQVNGEVIGLGIVAVDITERRESERRFRTVVDVMIDPLFMMTAARNASGAIADFIYDYANPAGEEFLGMSAAEIVGRRLLDLAPGARGDIFDHCCRIVETGESFSGELVYEGAIGHRGPDSRDLDVSAMRLGDGFVISSRDATAKRAAETALRRSEERFRSLIQHSTDIILVVDLDAKLLYVSPSALPVLGYEPEAMRGTCPLDLVHPDDFVAVAGALAAAAKWPGVAPAATFRVRRARGDWRWIEAVANNLLDDPTVGGLVINARDVTDRVEARRVIVEERRILEMIARSLPVQATLDALACEVQGESTDGWCEVSVLSRGHTSGWLAAPGAPIGFAGDQALLPDTTTSPQTTAVAENRPVFALARGPNNIRTPNSASAPLPDQPERGMDDRSEDMVAWNEWQGMAGGHEVHAAWVVPIALAAGEAPIGTVTRYRSSSAAPTFTDLGPVWAGANLAALAVQRFEAGERLAHQALHDELTGLPNRLLLADRLEQALLEHGRDDRATAVLFLDLDHFKLVNDSLGHSVGDHVLQEVARRLARAVRPGDTVARFGGDEFVVLCPSVRDAAMASHVAQRLLDTFATPFRLLDASRTLAASVGIAVCSGPATSAEELLRDADAAMYQAKKQGRNRVEIYGPGMEAQVLAYLQIETGLRTAIARGELVVHYQPQMDLRSGRMHGTEALVRWQHPELGLLPPGMFISVAEASGLIVALGEFVLATACRDTAAWNAAGLDLRIAVNVSARQLADPGLVGTVTGILNATGLDPARLCLELTESVLIDENVLLTESLRSLQHLGVQLSVDDFGTGYASLTTLKCLPVDELKIDKSFVQGLGVNPPDEAIVAAIIGLAANLRLGVVAEGVETDLQVQELIALGCTMGQGFRFAPGLPAEDITHWLDDRR
jgi:diguanylate cyclase (GGDEF)-like protein/PAS domain S-box-containing protein